MGMFDSLYLYHCRCCSGLIEPMNCQCVNISGPHMF